MHGKVAAVKRSVGVTVLQMALHIFSINSFNLPCSIIRDRARINDANSGRDMMSQNLLLLTAGSDENMLCAIQSSQWYPSPHQKDNFGPSSFPSLRFSSSVPEDGSFSASIVQLKRGISSDGCSTDEEVPVLSSQIPDARLHQFVTRYDSARGGLE